MNDRVLSYLHRLFDWSWETRVGSTDCMQWWKATSGATGKTPPSAKNFMYSTLINPSWISHIAHPLYNHWSYPCRSLMVSACQINMVFSTFSCCSVEGLKLHFHSSCLLYSTVSYTLIPIRVWFCEIYLYVINETGCFEQSSFLLKGGLYCTFQNASFSYCYVFWSIHFILSFHDLPRRLRVE